MEPDRRTGLQYLAGNFFHSLTIDPFPTLAFEYALPLVFLFEFCLEGRLTRFWLQGLISGSPKELPVACTIHFRGFFNNSPHLAS